MKSKQKMVSACYDKDGCYLEIGNRDGSESRVFLVTTNWIEYVEPLAERFGPLCVFYTGSGGIHVPELDLLDICEILGAERILDLEAGYCGDFAENDWDQAITIAEARKIAQMST